MDALSIRADKAARMRCPKCGGHVAVYGVRNGHIACLLCSWRATRSAYARQHHTEAQQTISFRGPRTLAFCLDQLATARSVCRSVVLRSLIEDGLRRGEEVA